MSGPHADLRIAVAGCGAVARQYHLRALDRLPGARVVAVADPDAHARVDAARAMNADAYADAAAAIARPDVDAVVVCAPNAAHADLAVTALDAGRHLYLEKPLATRTDDGRRVVAAAERAGTVATIGLSYRCDPIYARARALLREGVVGTVREVSTTYHEAVDDDRVPGWKRSRADGGGVLLDLGVHHLDLLEWLTGQTLAEVDHATLESRRGEHDSATVHARLTGGGTLEASFGYGTSRRCGWVFAGDDGWLAIDRGARRLTFARAGQKPRRRRGEALRARWRSLPVVRRERVFAVALGRWVDSATGRRSAELPTPYDGLRALEAVESIEAAAGAALRA